MRRPPHEIDAVTLWRVDTLGAISIIFDPHMHSGSRHAPIASLRRLCLAGVLRAESFSAGSTLHDEQIWIMRVERFRLPPWAKTRGRQWWPGTNT